MQYLRTPTRELERAETGYVKEGFLAEMPEWVRTGQLKENEAFQERDESAERWLLKNGVNCK